MKKKLIVVCAAVAMTVPVNSFAAAWKVPTNVRIVQKSNTDTAGNIYSNIQDAINSIPDATDTNPYLVKVMPGVYNEAVIMKPYVDLEGSGADNTVIAYSSVNTDEVCNVGTVKMANNTTLRNIKVVNNPPVDSGFQGASLVFNNAKAKAEGVSVLIGNDIDNNWRNIAVCLSGAGTDAILNNANIETHIAGGDAHAIYLQDGANLLVTNSHMVGVSTGETHMFAAMDMSSSDTGSLKIINSTFVGTAPIITTFYQRAYITSIINSTLTMNTGPSGQSIVPIFSQSEVTISNTKLIADRAVVYRAEGPLTKIDNSLIPGDYSTLLNRPEVKLFNNYDENYAPIPNQ